MNDKILIGVLAFNVEKYIKPVLDSLLILDQDILVIDDFSSDSTKNILVNYVSKNFKFLTNEKNYGAGYSTRMLIEYGEKNGYKFVIKVDGDGQFEVSDIKKIIDLRLLKGFDFIKSNRFWKDGIKGKIPKKRFFGNLLATIFLQVTTGTNKLFDPLNGLFGISTQINKLLSVKSYPKRYGYPYFITVSAVINEFKTHQINNVVNYEDQKSNLKPIILLLTIIKLSILFFFKKIKIKRTIGNYQRSAFLDILFIFSTTITIYFLIQLVYIGFFADTTLIKPGNLLFLSLFLLILSGALFISSFKEEKSIRNDYITIE